MKDRIWDLSIIGGGAGGVAAAVRASQIGAKVVVIEAEEVGGICMNRGCIPTKALMETACLYRSLRKAGDFGIRVSDVRIDWDALMAKKDDLVQYLRMGTEAVLRSNGVELLRGEASFASPNRIRVGEQELEAKAVILATGTRWSPPSIEGIEHEGVITTDEILTMRDVPSSVAALSSDPVALEAAQYLLFLGATVTLIEEDARILPQEDREISRRLSGALKEQGMKILTRVRVNAVHKDNSGLTLNIQGSQGEQKITVDRVLHVRRLANLESLGLHAAGLTPSEGRIPVNEFLQTPVPHIYAVGDVTGGPFYSHRAAAMGITAAENALAGRRPFRHETVPRAFYSFPAVASVGLTESEAKKRGYQLMVAAIPYSVNGRAMMMLETDGAVKVVADSQYGEILGVHIVGPYATELISEGVLAMELEATVEELANVVRLHPSLSESQGDAAREAMGRGIYVLR